MNTIQITKYAEAIQESLQTEKLLMAEAMHHVGAVGDLLNGFRQKPEELRQLRSILQLGYQEFDSYSALSTDRLPSNDFNPMAALFARAEILNFEHCHFWAYKLIHEYDLAVTDYASVLLDHIWTAPHEQVIGRRFSSPEDASEAPGVIRFQRLSSDVCNLDYVRTHEGRRPSGQHVLSVRRRVASLAIVSLTGASLFSFDWELNGEIYEFDDEYFIQARKHDFTLPK